MQRVIHLLSLLVLPLLSFSQNAVIPEIQLIPFASGLSGPLGLEHAGDARLFVVEQGGTIRFIDANGTVHSTFLDLSSEIGGSGEQGLLGLAFDPGYATNGYFYVHYTNQDGNNQFSRFSVDPNNPNQALLNSEVPFLEDNDPYSNHNGGQMKFGPDGYLYFTIGDGGSGGDPENRAQDVSSLEGKMFRIDPLDDGTYAIPPGNPYDNVNGAREEIWATGLRNPWRFSFDQLTGDLWIADVGQNLWEEIDVQPAASDGGENYGWSCDEGTHFFKADCDNNGVPFTDPIAEYLHDGNPDFPCGGSVTGGYVYRGSSYPNMYGKYLYIDYCTGVLRTTFWNGTSYTNAVVGSLSPGTYTTFGEDISGELYLVDQPSGIVYSIVDVSEILALPEPTPEDSDHVIAHSYQLSPNPNDGHFALRFNSVWHDQGTATIINMLGRIEKTEQREIMKGTNEWTFSDLNLPAGRYVLQIETSYGTHTLPFVTE